VEECIYEAGDNLLTATFTDYGIISAAELPSLVRIDQGTPKHR